MKTENKTNPIHVVILTVAFFVTLSGCKELEKVAEAMQSTGSGIAAIQTDEQPNGVYVARISLDKKEMKLQGGGAAVIPKSHNGEPHKTIFSPDVIGSALLVYSDYGPIEASNREQQPIIHILNTSDPETLGHMSRFNNIEVEIKQYIPASSTWYYVQRVYWVDDEHVAVRVAGSWNSHSGQTNNLLLTYDRMATLTDQSWISINTGSPNTTHQKEAGARMQIQNGQLVVDGSVPVRNPQHPAIQSFTPRAANGLMYTNP